MHSFVKKYAQPAVLVLLVLAGILITLSGLPFRTGNPFDDGFRFVNPKAVLAGDSGDYWVLDMAQRRISRIAPDNRVDWTVEGSRKGPRTLDKIWMIGMDEKGTVWVQNIVTNPEEATTEREEILALGADGHIGTPIDFRDYDKKTRSDFLNAMTFIQLHDGVISYFYPLGDGRSELTRIDTYTGESEVETVAFDCLSYTDIHIASPSLFYLLDNRGSVWVSDNDGNKRLYSPNPDGGPLQLRNPLSMMYGPSGVFHVLDGKNRIVGILADGNRKAGPLDESRKLSLPVLSVNAQGLLSGPDEYSGNPVLFDPDGTVSVRTGQRYSLPMQLERLAVWLALFLGGAAFCRLAFMVYANFFKRRVPLIIKQLIMFIPLIVIAVILIAVLVYSQMFRNLENQVNRNLLLLGQIGSRQMDTGPVERLDPTAGIFDDLTGGDDYSYLDKYLNDFVGGNLDSWNSSTYAYIYRKYRTDWYIIGPWEYVELFVYAKPEFNQVLADGKPRVVRYDDVYGEWYSGLSPVRDAEGRIIAIFEVTINGQIFDQFNDQFARDLFRSVIVILAVLIGFFSGSTWFLLLSLKSLKQGAICITEGNYDHEIGIHTRDELEDLGTAFNRMSSEIRKQISHVTDLNKANSKFVPSEFLRFLGKSSILDIALGDHMEGSMSVLFSDIRGFTGISEKMTPDENFHFINEYLELMGPVIREKEGFIDKYIGDAIMAIFPRRPDDALHAAMEMLDRLEGFNGKNPDLGRIRFGIGIHTGRIMMGIIGESERYEGTVIADAVNLASRLEGLTKQYGVSVIVSEETIASLSRPGDFDMRRLDLVRVKGKQKPSAVYEVISPVDPLRDYKLGTRELYREAFDLYRKQDFVPASALFENLLAQCPEDKAAESLLRRCQRLLAEGTGATWDGIIELRDK